MTTMEDEAWEVLRDSTIDFHLLFLPPVQIDRQLYRVVNKLIEKAGGKWDRTLRAHVFDGPVPVTELKDKAKTMTQEKKEEAKIPVGPLVSDLLKEMWIPEQSDFKSIPVSMDEMEEAYWCEMISRSESAADDAATEAAIDAYLSRVEGRYNATSFPNAKGSNRLWVPRVINGIGKRVRRHYRGE